MNVSDIPSWLRQPHREPIAIIHQKPKRDYDREFEEILQREINSIGQQCATIQSTTDLGTDNNTFK